MELFNILKFIIPIFAVVMISFIGVMFFSPKLRGKFMAKQAKSLKYMMDDSKETFTDVGTTMGNISVDIQENIIDQNSEKLQRIGAKQGKIAVDVKEDILNENESKMVSQARREANISREKMTIMAEAIKEGFSGEEIVYCKHCGAKIDEDSKFCRSCGKEQ